MPCKVLLQRSTFLSSYWPQQSGRWPGEAGTAGPHSADVYQAAPELSDDEVAQVCRLASEPQQILLRKQWTADSGHGALPLLLSPFACSETPHTCTLSKVLVSDDLIALQG